MIANAFEMYPENFTFQLFQTFLFFPRKIAYCLHCFFVGKKLEDSQNNKLSNFAIGIFQDTFFMILLYDYLFNSTLMQI